MLTSIFGVAFRPVGTCTHNFACFRLSLLVGLHIVPSFYFARIQLFPLALLGITCLRGEHLILGLVLGRLVLNLLFFISYILKVAVHRLRPVEDGLIHTTSDRVDWYFYLYV